MAAAGPKIGMIELFAKTSAAVEEELQLVEPVAAVTVVETETEVEVQEADRIAPEELGFEGGIP